MSSAAGAAEEGPAPAGAAKGLRATAGAGRGVEERGRRAASGDGEGQLQERLAGWRIGAGGPEEEEAAAGKLQRWWRAERRVGQTARVLLGQRERLQSAAAVLADKSSKGFEDVLQRIQSKELIASVSSLLAAVDGPNALPPMSPRLQRSPRAVEAARQQQARKFLTSIMIKHHPEEVIAHTSASSSAASFDDEAAAGSGGGGGAKRGSLDSMEARLLRVAAHLALASAVALVEALDGLEKGNSPGAGGTFRVRLGAFVLARGFLHEALEVLQAVRTSGVAAAFLTSYGEAYRYLKDAERAQQAALVAQARQSLDKVKLGIAKVIGRERTERHCLSVERALDSHEPFVVLSPGDIKVPLPAMGSPRRAAAAPQPASGSSTDTGAAPAAGPAASSLAGGAAAADAGGLEAEAAAAAAAAEQEELPVPASLTALLRNEHLAHEIILDPEFRLEDRGAGGGQQQGPLAQQLAQVRETMEKMFWDRLTLALTPPEQERDEDFVPGALVQLRIQQQQQPEATAAEAEAASGSFFEARVEAVHPAGQFGREEALVDVVYLGDGLRERRRLAELRRKGDPLDFGPLLALLDDVRAKLAELTPKRADLAAELRAHLDTALLGQMACRGALDGASVRGALAFAVGRLTQLQAPARAAETAAWFAEVDARAAAALAESGGQIGPAFVALLPGLFKTVFDRIDETRRDAANAHVAMLRPFLARHGVAYERQKFQERLRAGEVKLQHTQAWLRDSLAQPAARPALPAVARGDASAHRRAMADALGRLLVRPVRLDNPVAAKLPETLFYDGRRLAGVRDELDRLTLVAVYSTLLRQFLAAQPGLRPSGAAGEVLVALETRLYTILQDDRGEVKLPHLVDEAVAAAKRVFEAAADPPAPMAPTQAATLRGVLTSAVSFENPLFALLFARLAEVLGAFARGEAAGPTGGAAELVARYGFRPFEPQLAKAGAGLRRVLDHSVAVHGELYSRILKQEAATLLLVAGGDGEGEGGSSAAP